MGRRRNILLLELPFAIHDAPSLAMGRLKSALLADGYQCDVRYLNVELSAYVGERAYDELRPIYYYWLCELIYAAELFPKHVDRKAFIKHVDDIHRRHMFGASPPSIISLRNNIHKFNQALIREWEKGFDYDAVGISANYYLMPALFYAYWIKKMHPDVDTILGGSQCTGEVGHAIARTFSFIDWVVTGEGEKSIVEIANLLGKKVKHIPNGTCHRDISKLSLNSNKSEPVDIDSLPFPDYDDYISSCERTSSNMSAVSMEMGRGCWWDKCAYCGFSSIGSCYRRMSDRRIVESMEHLASRHQILNFWFVDNLQPPGIKHLSNAISASPYDFKWSIMLRPDIPSDQLEAMKRSGLESAYFGVESLSTTLLKKMNKGSTAIKNILTLREARRHGILANILVISDFPSGTRDDMRENHTILRNIPHLFEAIGESRFYLQYGSDVYTNPERYGIRNVRPSVYYKWLLPTEYRFSPTVYWDYSPKPRNRKLYISKQEDYKNTNLLLFNGANQFCIIYDTRGEVHKYRLTDKYSDVLLACNSPMERNKLNCNDDILDDLISAGLLIEDEGKYLCVAIRQ